MGVGGIKIKFHEQMFWKRKRDKDDQASAADVDGAVGGTAEEVGAAGGVEVAVGAAEVAGAVGSAGASVASISFCTSVDSLVLAESASVCLALGEVWDEPLSESSESRCR